ncbi:hypothetical protein [Roseofilum casamattae]|uniref:Uncharacterized protein n=1 Tax=Roseofilum casamattae BLCC-M143 TaxID=3022442 RepID=A0ABT7BSF0_9CYAN|nr:hypothetical protein [Roseofilum casamattae]MDJ1182115.1 hypothetical protein [Roseofilum casamattae BLCC-M143]
MANFIPKKLLVIASLAIVQIPSMTTLASIAIDPTTNILVNTDTSKKENPEPEDDLIVPPNFQLAFVEPDDDASDDDPIVPTPARFAFVEVEEEEEEDIVPTNVVPTSFDIKLAGNNGNPKKQDGSSQSISPPNAAVEFVDTEGSEPDDDPIVPPNWTLEVSRTDRDEENDPIVPTNIEYESTYSIG